MIEAWGRGIAKMIDACKEMGLPNPDFSYEFGGLMVSFAQNSQKTSEKTSEKILDLLRRDSKTTIQQLAKNLGITTRSIERNLQQLRNSGKIRRVGGDKGGIWEVLE